MIRLFARFLGSKASGYIALSMIAILSLGVLYVQHLRHEVHRLGRMVNQLDVCLENQRISDEVTNAYYTQISSLNERVAALKRMYDKRSVSVTYPSRGTNEAEEQGHVIGDAVPAPRLYEYAGDCEETRLQLTNLQLYITKTTGD